jgi:YwiC-like protein
MHGVIGDPMPMDPVVRRRAPREGRPSRRRSRTAGRGRSLFPREHGAYAQLGVPLVTALAVSRPNIAGACIALAGCAVFVAHEPALVLLGQRGTRARREASAFVGRLLFVSLLAAGTLAAAGLVLSSAARPWLALSAALALVAGGFALARVEKTLAGELVACAALTSAATPVAAAGGLPWPDAVATWAVFWVAFAVATVEVRAVARRHADSLPRTVAWLLACGILAALAVVRPKLAISIAPVLAVLAFAAVRPMPAAALRRLGWRLAASSLATALAVVAALR